LKKEYWCAIIHWFNRRHKVSVSKEWLVFTPGIVPAINFAIQALTKPGDRIIIQTPVYGPFFTAVTNNERTLVCNPLILDKTGKYVMNLHELRHQAKAAKLLILCSPHNPVGRVWTKEELDQLSEIVLENNLYVIADEIHCDITYEGFKHIPFYTINEYMAQRCLVCTSISKTFNLPGFQVANIIIPNPEIRRLYNLASAKVGFWGPNVFTPVVTIAAYSPPSEIWFNEVMKYIKNNLQFMKTYLKEHLKDIKLIEPQGTTLAWLNFNGLNLSAEEINNKIILGGLALGNGLEFGEPGRGFIRINLGCPLSIVKKALKILHKIFYPHTYLDDPEPWSFDNNYYKDDKVNYNGEIWICLNYHEGKVDRNRTPGIAPSLWKKEIN